MNIFEAIFLGITQGLTEFLPVSSTGHLIVLEKLFKIQKGLTFDVFIHLASFLAVLIFFKEIWKKIIFTLPSFFKKPDFQNKNHRLILQLSAGTIPVIVFGWILKDYIESSFRNLSLVAFNLIFFGIILFLADHFLKHQKNIENISLKEAFLIGLFQSLAFLPGISRSGITIIGGMFCGLKKEKAVEFSFLLSFPAIFLAGAFEVFKIKEQVALNSNFLPYFFGFLSAFLASILAIKFLLAFIKKHSFDIFVFWRIILGLLLLLILWF